MPSPPNKALLMLPIYLISKSTFSVKATTQPGSTSREPPSASSFLMSEPQE